MKFFGLVGLVSAVIVSACASKKPITVLEDLQYYPSGIYEFVSMDLDLSIYGKFGTTPVDGKATFSLDGFVSFDFINPILGQGRVVENGTFEIVDDFIVFKVSGTTFGGKLETHAKGDEIYLTITFDSSSSESGAPNWVLKKKIGG